MKLVGPDGRKLADDARGRDRGRPRSNLLRRDLTSSGPETPSSGRRRGPTSTRTSTHLLGALDGRTLDGLHVVVDCANGAASELGAACVARQRARASTVLHAEPDGRNINEGCGSTYPQELQAAVRAHGADLGLALDGDADRVVAVDERGDLVDGDQIMVLTALDRHERGVLRNDAIVVTVMSNLGLRRALAAAGVGIVETPVGDRNVTAAMAAHDLAIGGEQSGHIVFADLATTGDGVLTGLLVADVVARRGRPLSALAGAMTRLPQVLVNVRVAGAVDLDDGPVQETIRKVEAELGDRGRVMVRSSGTEPVVRVMVEAPTEDEAAAAAATIRAALEP